MGTCHYWTDDVMFSGLYRWNARKHTANNANSFLQTQREEWIWHILGGDLLGREFSGRVCLLNLCPCVADCCQLEWSVYPECQGESCPGKQRLTLNCLFLLSMPDTVYRMSCMLSCLIRVVMQTRIYHCFSVSRPPSTSMLSCLAHGSWFGVCFSGLFFPLLTILPSAALPQSWRSPPVPDLQCLY